MLAPLLEHHREEFDGLKELQVLVAIWTFLGGFATILGALVLSHPQLAKWLCFGWLGAGGVVLLAIEMKKISVLRSDLRERQESTSDAS